MKPRYDTVDAVKLLASILIFSMHCSALADFGFANTVLQTLARWGVPFFFIATSFFLFSGSGGQPLSDTKLKNYILRILKLYGIWFIINLPNVLYNHFYGRDLGSISTWLLFIKNILLSSGFSASWYLTSCVFSSWMVSRLSRHMKTKQIILFATPFYLLCALTSMYSGLLTDAQAGVLEFLCFPLNIFAGLFYFAIGKYIAENKEALEAQFNRKNCFLLAVGFYCLFTLEIALSSRIHVFSTSDSGIFLAMVSAFLFLCCIQSGRQIKNPLLLRKLSTIIYCCQANILSIRGFCASVLGIQSSLLLFAGSALAAAVICVLVLWAQKRARGNWVQYLT